MNLLDALSRLEELAHHGATGELVCAGTNAEVHVYLQGGRIAWATDSTSPFAFRRWLIEHTSLTLETYLEVLEACRIERLPVGQTLIEWGAVTPEDVAGALEFQIAGALSSLRGCEAARALFLERAAVASHDATLSFAFAELVVPRSSPAVRAAGLVDRLAAEIPNARFELLDGDVVASGESTTNASRVDPALAAASVTDGAELIAYRSQPGTVLGVALSPRTSIWCRLDRDTAFSGPLDAICKAAAIEATLPSEPPASHGSRRVGEHAPLLDAIYEFHRRVPEVLGLVVAEQGKPVATVHRLPTDPAALTSLVRRRVGLLQLDTQASFMTSERDLWCFGSRSDRSERTLWLFLDRSSTPGLGWAYLPSLERHLHAALGAPA